VSDETDGGVREKSAPPVKESGHGDAAEPKKPPNPTSGLGNDLIDASRVTEYSPESWDERPEYDDGADRYAADRPPHHGE